MGSVALASRGKGWTTWSLEGMEGLEDRAEFRAVLAQYLQCLGNPVSEDASSEGGWVRKNLKTKQTQSCTDKFCYVLLGNSHTSSMWIPTVMGLCSEEGWES